MPAIYRHAAMASCAAVLACACGREPQPRRQQGPNPPSQGVIDIPADGERVGPVVTVAGWTLDESGVDRVRIYADDRMMVSVPVTLPRPDVARAMPEHARADARHGWEATIDFGEFVGYVTLHAEAIDGRGALTRFARVTVKVDP